MPTYDSPFGYSAKTSALMKARAKLMKDLENGKQSQWAREIFQFTPEQVAAKNAINEQLNQKEVGVDVLDQQILDQYPSGTRYLNGDISRNTAGYGVPPQMPVDMNAVKGGQEMPYPMVPNPLYREGGILPKMIPSDMAAKLANGM